MFLGNRPDRRRVEARRVVDDDVEPTLPAGDRVHHRFDVAGFQQVGLDRHRRAGTLRVEFFGQRVGRLGRTAVVNRDVCTATMQFAYNLGADTRGASSDQRDFSVEPS